MDCAYYMSIMSMPTCVAQTDGCAKFCYTHQRPNVGLLMVHVHILYCHIVPWTAWEPRNLYLLSLHVHFPKYGFRSEHLFVWQQCIQFSMCACSACHCMVMYVLMHGLALAKPGNLRQASQYMHV